MDATNWYAQLSQEIRVGGQRGAQTRAAESEVTAQTQRTAATSRGVAADAWAAYFEVLAATEEVRMAVRLETNGKRLAEVTRARADRGLSSPVDADVVEAAALRLQQQRLGAERRGTEARADLAVLFGVAPADIGAVEGELTPIEDVEAAARALAPRAADERPDVQALRSERTAQSLRADAFRRARIPNPRLSVFVQNDGFDEKVFGAGIAVPIPLPHPVGRTYAGEIAESEALAARAGTEAERRSRAIRAELEVALKAYESRKEELAAFGEGRLARADEALAAITSEIEAGRLPVRDAIVSQQALTELVRSYVEARRALCIASVDLARAAGVPLDRGTP